MASWIVHLRVAENLLKEHSEWHAGYFAIGNIAPDSGLPLNTSADKLDFGSMENALNLPVYIINSSDDKVAPGKRVGLVAAVLKKYDCPDIVHDEFPGGARVHAGDSWGKVYDWFMRKSRNLFPKKIQLNFDGTGSQHAYWLELVKPQAGARATARIEQGRIEITVSKARGVTIYLSDRIVNLDNKITVRINNKRVFREKVKRSAAMALKTCLLKNDRHAAYACRLSFNLEEPSDK